MMIDVKKATEMGWEFTDELNLQDTYVYYLEEGSYILPRKRRDLADALLSDLDSDVIAKYSFYECDPEIAFCKEDLNESENYMIVARKQDFYSKTHLYNKEGFLEELPTREELLDEIKDDLGEEFFEEFMTEVENDGLHWAMSDYGLDYYEYLVWTVPLMPETEVNYEYHTLDSLVLLREEIKAVPEDKELEWLKTMLKGDSEDNLTICGIKVEDSEYAVQGDECIDYVDYFDNIFDVMEAIDEYLYGDAA